MSPQESQALQDFLNQLVQVRGIAKDAQADALIAAAVARQPDAAYLLVQRALLMEQALNASKAQVASLQAQVQSLQAGGGSSPGFLDGNAWGNAPSASARPGPAPAPAYMPGYAAAPAPLQTPQPYQPAPAPAASSGFFGGGMGSMLGTVAATAAGVAGGAFLFQGIEHMMNGNGGSGFLHQNAMSAPVENIENTTVNNYYGSDERNGDRGSERNSDQASDSSVGSSNDLADLGNIDFDDSAGYDDSVV
ncbi:DUF2076 domain-containing protein [Herbaspirillum sp. NPDC087042]|uniref:DUF2076 domain-containing protein n=1 Tax=Herbaspirillum sp. NPDC087042 TaxID=3364004 RepID=UPI0038080E79